MEISSGKAAFHHWLLLYRPVVDGRFPSIMAFREGQQTVAEVCAFVKATPSVASRSIFGV